MKLNDRGWIVAAIIMLICLFPVSSMASDQTTFESFYKEGGTIVIWMSAAAAAIAGGALLYFSAGTATPIVASMGTWVGSMMGYSGIAATNAGLALLGGGSVASGGLGMLGGTALLTAALMFVPGVAIDSSFNRVVEEYNYSQFVEKSRNMASLPFPKNSSGPDSYEAAYEVLEKANKNESPFSNFNQGVTQEAIHVLQTTEDRSASSGEIARSQTLLALLQFLSNDYVSAKVTANNAYRLARSVDDKATLPAFIYSVSSLYDKKINFAETLKFFQWSIEGELSNPLTPLLFAAYLDRMMYRLNDGALSPNDLSLVYDFTNSLEYDKRKYIIQLGLLNRYLIRLFSEQSNIKALTGTENKVIRGSLGTLSDAKASLERYKKLLLAANTVLQNQVAALDYRRNSRIGPIDKIRWKEIQDWELEWGNRLSQIRIVLPKYSGAVAEMELQVKKLEDYQNQLKIDQAEKLKKDQEAQQKSQKTCLWIFCF